MIQFNLLPDVKLDYIKATRRKRLAMVGASTVIIISIAITTLLFAFVNGFQKRHISALGKDINQHVSELQGTEDLNKILTIQNQLIKLPELHNQKPVVTRLFNYITQITPVEISISRFDLDLIEQKISLTGTGTTLAAVNTLVDTLKFTNYILVDDKGEPLPDQSEVKAFSKVVLSSFGRTDNDVSYNIDLLFDPAIFDSSKSVKLVVPNTVTTRSETEKPLFETNSETH